MSAPVLWIFLPILVGGLLLLVSNQKLLALLSGFLCSFLALAAFLLPIDELVTVQSFTFKLTPAFNILGRAFILSNSDRGWLALFFGASAFWFMASSTINIARRLVPIGLILTGLLVASLSVEPFLYAALLIEVAVLLSIPLLSPPGKKPGKGILRFLIFQTMAMPFLLLAGWLLSGISANPGNLDLVVISAVILGLGFALLLAVFPFYTWIPLLAEEAHPYIAGFILWSFPTVSMFFALNFLDRYAWLRDAAGLSSILVIVGVVMVVAAGTFALFQRHLGRTLGYAVMLEIGFSLLCVGLGSSLLDTYLMLYIPRVIAFALWALTLTNLQKQYPSLLIEDIKGAGRSWSLSVLGLVMAGFSISGLPLLASFPAHLVIWSSMAYRSQVSVVWVFLGSLGMLISTIRGLVALLNAPKNTPWGLQESIPQRGLILFACLALVILGIFPSLVSTVWQNLPPLFEHFGQ